MKRNYCMECAAGKKGAVSCCVSPFREDVPGFFLTLPDVARIVKATGRNPREFCKIVDFSEEDYDEEGEDKYGFLNKKLEFDDQSILMKGKRGKCFFLGNKGCTIFHFRPRMCRIHPFWFKRRGKGFKVLAEWEKCAQKEECLMGKEHFKSKNLSHLLGCMGETRRSMNACVKGLIKDLDLHDKHKWDLEEKSILKVIKENGFN